MSKSNKIDGSIEAWEDGVLGRDEEFAEKSNLIDELKLDQAFRLKTISIRLESTLIDDFKIIAGKNNIKYQPLMKQVLRRFADAEMKNILRELRAEEIEKCELEGDAPKVKMCG